MPTAEIVAIGSELLLGQIIDTNSAWLADRLSKLGVDLYHKTVVGDNHIRMVEVIDKALDRSDVVITSGGLGPTQDDITRECLAEVAGEKLVLDQRLLDQIDKRFKLRGHVMTNNNQRQAYIPEGSVPIDNPNGTAPSFVIHDPRGIVFALPGVPVELKWLFDNEVVPYLHKQFSLTEVIVYKVLKVVNMGESNVDDLIGHLIAGLSNPTVGVLAHPGQVDVRITAKSENEELARKMIEPVEREIRSLLGRHVFAVDDETIGDVVGSLLKDAKVKVGVYEDATGGLFSYQVKTASFDNFSGAIIGRSFESVQCLDQHYRQPDCWEKFRMNPGVLTEELAWAVRSYTDSDIGVAIHSGYGKLGSYNDNVAKGDLEGTPKTFISVTDGEHFSNREHGYLGVNSFDCTRLSSSAMDVLRVVIEDFGG